MVTKAAKTKTSKASKASKAGKASKASKVSKATTEVSPTENLNSKKTVVEVSTEVSNVVPHMSVPAPVGLEVPPTIEDLIDDLLKEQARISEIHKSQGRHIKELVKLYKREKKMFSKKQKKKRDPSLPNKPNVFTTPTKLSDKLCSFLNKPTGTELARTEVTKAISKYIKKNNLSVPENKKQFIPDNNLMTILGPLQEKDLQKGYTYFNLQRYIRDEFVKTPTEQSVST